MLGYSNGAKVSDSYPVVFLSALAQIILVPIASLAVILPIGAVLAGSGPHPTHVHHPLDRFGMPPISFFVGYLFGWCVCRLLPSFARGGRWAWIVPTLFFVRGFLASVTYPGALLALVSMFDVEGTEDVGVILVSLPLLFSIGYSISCVRRGGRDSSIRILLFSAILFLSSGTSWAAEPKAEVISLQTLVVEQDQIENPNAVLSGNVVSMTWEQLRIESNTPGDPKELAIHSIRTTYQTDGQPTEEIDQQASRETRTASTYQNGLLIRTRGQTTSKDTGKVLGEEFWQSFKYDAAGRLLDLQRGRGERVQNHFVSKYDASGRLVRREIRQGESDSLVYAEQFRYTTDLHNADSQIELPGGNVKRLTRFQLDGEDRVVELWSDAGYHVRWKYDSQGRITEQATDSYHVPEGCDSCPIPGKIQVTYEGLVRDQVFLSPSGKSVLRRVSQLEKDGSIASIRYERIAGARPEDAPDLYRVVSAILPRGNRYVETKWDEHANWIEKREYVQPSGGDPILQFIYRRTFLYRK